MAWATPVTHVTGDVVSASDWNIGTNDLIYLYGDLTWTVPTYTNSWVNFASGITNGFRKIGTRVVFRGGISGGTINTAAFTLPVGYRPTAATLNIGSASNLAFGLLSITSAGVVTPVTGSNTWFSLDNVTFDTI